MDLKGTVYNYDIMRLMAMVPLDEQGRVFREVNHEEDGKITPGFNCQFSLLTREHFSGSLRNAYSKVIFFNRKAFEHWLNFSSEGMFFFLDLVHSAKKAMLLEITRNNLNTNLDVSPDGDNWFYWYTTNRVRLMEELNEGHKNHNKPKASKNDSGSSIHLI